MLVNGSTIRLKDKESTLIMMEQPTKESGWRTSSTAKAWRPGPTERSTQATISMARNTDTDSSVGPTGLTTRENSRTTTFKARESTNGLTGEGSTETG